jgi:hypothetical protein
MLKGRRFRHATIVPDDGDGSLGHVYFRVLRAFDPEIWSAGDWVLDDGRKAKRLDDEVCILVAGMAAEAIYTGRRNWRGAHSDYRAAVNLASYRFRGWNDAITAYLRWQAAEAERLMTQNPLNWKWVQAVAKRLIREKTLTEANVRQTLRSLSQCTFPETVAKSVAKQPTKHPPAT